MIKKHTLALSILCLAILQSSCTKTSDATNTNATNTNTTNTDTTNTDKSKHSAPENTALQNSNNSQNTPESNTTKSAVSTAINAISAGLGSNFASGFGSGLGSGVGTTLTSAILTRCEFLKTENMKRQDDADTRFKVSQADEQELKLYAYLITAPTAQELRLKKSLDDRKALAETKFSEIQTEAQEISKDNARITGSAEAYKKACEAYNFHIGGNKEEQKEHVKNFKAVIGDSVYTQQTKVLREEMKKTLRTRNEVVAVTLRKERNRLEQELEELELETDEYGFVKEKTISIESVNKEIAPKNNTPVDSKYDTYIDAKRNQLEQKFGPKQK